MSPGGKWSRDFYVLDLAAMKANKDGRYLRPCRVGQLRTTTDKPELPWAGRDSLRFAQKLIDKAASDIAATDEKPSSSSSSSGANIGGNPRLRQWSSSPLRMSGGSPQQQEHLSLQPSRLSQYTKRVMPLTNPISTLPECPKVMNLSMAASPRPESRAGHPTFGQRPGQVCQQKKRRKPQLHTKRSSKPPLTAKRLPHLHHQRLLPPRSRALNEKGPSEGNLRLNGHLACRSSQSLKSTDRS